MRALLVDPSRDAGDFVTEIEIESWKDIAPTIGGECNIFTCVDIGGDHTMYVDDEGLINGQVHDVGVFALRNYPQPLAGRGIIQGVNEEGESTPCELSLKDAQKLIGIYTSLGPIFMA